MNQPSILIVVILLFVLLELDKKMYKKLDDNYKKFILKDKYDETERHYNSNSIVQFMENVENHTKGRKIPKVVGFLGLLLFIFLYNKIDNNHSIEVLKFIGILVFITLVILGLYGLVKGIKKVNEYKKHYNKEDISLEMLYTILHSSYFFIVVIIFYIVRVKL